jgi:pectinesterase
MEYNNRGEGADKSKRAAWSRQLTKKEAAQVTLKNVFRQDNSWIPAE